MGIFDNLFNKSEPVKDLNSTPTQKFKVVSEKSVYLNGLRGVENLRYIDVKVSNEAVIRYNLDYDFGSGSILKPLHDYDFLILNSGSDLDNIPVKRIAFDDAVKKGIPIIVTCDANSGNFFDTVKAHIGEFSVFKHRDSGSEALKIKDYFDTWWNFLHSYNYVFIKTPNHAETLAVNKVDHAIAWRYNNFFIIPGKSMEWLNYEPDWSVQVSSQDSNEDRGKYIKNLISFIHHITPYSTSPEWINDISFLNEKDLLNNFKTTESQLRKIKNLKKIYYLTGKELEDMVKIFFNEVGIKIKKIDDMDWVIENNPSIIVEITGITKNIRKEKVGQIIGDLIQSETKLGKDAIKTLLINHQRLIHPKERAELEPKILELYKKKDINVVDIRDFIELFEKVINGEKTKEDIIKLFLL